MPAAHYLESWGDALTADGAYLAIQPMILPLFGGLSEIDLMNAVLGGPKVEGPELVQETFRAERPHRRFRDGLVEISCTTVSRRTFSCATNRRRSTATPPAASRTRFGAPTPPPTPESPEIVLVGSYAIDDGRYINNGWLQEMPDPITKLTWDNAALMSPALCAMRSGCKTAI